MDMEQVHMSIRPLLLKLGDYRSLNLQLIQVSSQYSVIISSFRKVCRGSNNSTAPTGTPGEERQRQTKWLIKEKNTIAEIWVTCCPLSLKTIMIILQGN